MLTINQNDTNTANSASNSNSAEKNSFFARRKENSDKFKHLNKWLMIIFPVFICCMAEINQDKYVLPFFSFCAERPTVLLFDILISALVFIMLTAIFRKGWVSMAVQSFIYMALSTTELFPGKPHSSYFGSKIKKI